MSIGELVKIASLNDSDVMNRLEELEDGDSVKDGVMCLRTFRD